MLFRLKYKAEDYLSDQFTRKKKLSTTSSQESADFVPETRQKSVEPTTTETRQKSVEPATTETRQKSVEPPAEAERAESPVILRHKTAAATDVRKLVELKQPEPSTLVRSSSGRTGADPDKKRSWTNTKDVWASSVGGGVRAVARPVELHLEETTAISRDSSHRNSDISTSKINFGQIDDTVNVKERASLFGSRSTGANNNNKDGGNNKLRTVSVGSGAPPVTESKLRTAEKLRTVSVGGCEKGGSKDKNPRKFSATSHATSPSKIKNMAAFFENK